MKHRMNLPLLSRILALVMVTATLLAVCPPVSINAAGKNVVITLDPGHGGRTSDDGSTSTGTPAAEAFGGVNELYYNLSISLYAKERLEQYANVEVYLTRDNNEDCPGLKERADIATSHNSDALISIHNNSGGATAKGAEVIIPNQNYRSTIGTQSKQCATAILDSLVSKTGVARRTIYTKNSTSVTYPDGSVADHFQVIRNGKLQNIPVVMIVECAFLSSQEDYQNHFTTEAGLKRMGYAVADGIAKYYNLSPKDGGLSAYPKVYKFWSNVDYVNGKGPNGSNNFTSRGGNYTIGMDTIDAVAEGVKVAEDATMSIGGWMGVDGGGTARYVYSVDGGKTWMPTTGGYDGEPQTGIYAQFGLSNATKMGLFRRSVSPLVADLTAYKGQTVNVIFGAVAAADNVTVIPFLTVSNYTVPGQAPEGTTTEPDETTTEPDDETTTEPEETPTSYIPGDVNLDGEVNGKDITLVRRYNADWDVEIYLPAADVNADGYINGKDITLLRRYNADWDVELLPGLVQE